MHRYTLMVIALVTVFLQSCMFQSAPHYRISKESRTMPAHYQVYEFLKRPTQLNDVLLAFGTPQVYDKERRELVYVILETGQAQMIFLVPVSSGPVSWNSGSEVYRDHFVRMQFNQEWQFIAYERYRIERKQYTLGPRGAGVKSGRRASDRERIPLKMPADYYTNPSQHFQKKYLIQSKRARWYKSPTE